MPLSPLEILVILNSLELAPQTPRVVDLYARLQAEFNANMRTAQAA